MGRQQCFRPPSAYNAPPTPGHVHLAAWHRRWPSTPALSLGCGRDERRTLILSGMPRPSSHTPLLATSTGTNALGERQARGVGDFLRAQDTRSMRWSAPPHTRSADLDQLALPVEPSRVEISEDYYNVVRTPLLEALRALPPTLRRPTGRPCAGVPSVPWSWRIRRCRKPRRWRPSSSFPAAAIARLEFDGAWAGLAAAALVECGFREI